MEPAVFDTKPLLRPQQVEDAQAEIRACEEKLQSKHIEDKGTVAKQMRRLQQTLDSQLPRAPETPEEEGRMVARSKALLDQILVGMPSQEEMRKAPPGAVDKHIGWEKRNKLAILEWKNLQLRLTHGREAEAANLERHRPTGSSLNMDNAYIPGRQFFMPETTSPSVPFSDEQLAILELMAPGLREKLALMTNAQRSDVRSLVEKAKGEGIGLAAHTPDPVRSAAGKRGAEKKKRILTQQQLDNLARGRAEAKAKREAAKADKE
jgi:hypothetical protein